MEKNIKTRPHSSYPPTSFSPCDFLSFPHLKQSLAGQKMNSRSSPASAIFHCLLYIFPPPPPEGRPGISDVSPLSGISGLSFDSTLLSPLWLFCLVLLLFLSYLFFPACWSILLNFFQKFFQYFLLRDRLFCMVPI